MDDPKKLLRLMDSIRHVLIGATARLLQRPKKTSPSKTHSGKGSQTINNMAASETDRRGLILGDTVQQQ
jgi:hypothetical protein